MPDALTVVAYFLGFSCILGIWFFVPVFIRVQKTLLIYLAGFYAVSGASLITIYALNNGGGAAAVARGLILTAILSAMWLTLAGVVATFIKRHMDGKNIGPRYLREGLMLGSGLNNSPTV